MDVKWTYFQYRKAFNYPVYLRFKSEDLHDRFKHLLGEMGFIALSEAESKKISLQRLSTKILSVQTASARLQHQICGSELLDTYGQESLSLQAGVPVYTYRRVGLMVMPPSRIWWELGLSSDIHQTDQMVGLRVLLVRFLAHALADLGVLCYWGTFKDEYVIIMKQVQSFGEAVLIDINKKMIFSNGGEEKLHLGLKILRKDKDNLSGSHLKREDLISFLSVSTCLLSFTGITAAMRKSIMDLSSVSSASYSYRAPSLDV